MVPKPSVMVDEGTGMSTDLAGKVCTPCQGGVAPLSPDEAACYLAEVPGWTPADEGSAIERRYRFGNFREALAFVGRVGALAESEGHHPDICFGWGYAKVALQTKKIKGLHENDFIMAAKIEQLVSAWEGA